MSQYHLQLADFSSSILHYHAGSSTCYGTNKMSSVYKSGSAIFKTALPKFSPRSMATNASGPFSMPTVISSLALILPSCNHYTLVSRCSSSRGR